MGGKTEILQLVEIDYSQLEKKESVHNLMKALGPEGPGLLAVTGVPNADLVRNKLLPCARKLALLDDKQRRHILKDHGLGTDVSLRKPDRNVSSFAAQINFAENLSSKLDHQSVSSGGNIYNKPKTALSLEENLESKIVEQDHSQRVISQEFQHGDDFEGLGKIFKQLGFCMVDVGLKLAQMCDQVIGGIELEKAILDAQTAKGRLIHYHSFIEKALLMSSANAKRTSKKVSVKDSRFHSGCIHSNKVSSVNKGHNMKRENHLSMAEKNASFHQANTSSAAPDLWQEWHYDYGIFTLLTAPLFLSSFQLPIRSFENGIVTSQAQECSSPDGHTYLKILNTVNGKLMFANAPSTSLIVQVGEAAQILSGGKLRATAHCVCRPAGRTDISRETFVVFLQPAWSKLLSPPKWFHGERESTNHNLGDISANPSTEMMQENKFKININSLSLALSEHEPASENVEQEYAESTETFTQNLNDSKMLINEILKIVPPLMSRWKGGQTFAEFSRETTRKYYGADGIQSNK